MNRSLRLATLCFFAVMTFLVGLIALPGAKPLFDGAAWVNQVVVVLTVGAPLVFIGWAAFEALRPTGAR
jgi:hypothetical protein